MKIEGRVGEWFAAVGRGGRGVATGEQLPGIFSFALRAILFGISPPPLPSGFVYVSVAKSASGKERERERSKNPIL